MLMANGITDLFSRKSFIVLLSSFFPGLVHLLENNVIGHVFEAPRRVLKVDVFKYNNFDLRIKKGLPIFREF